MRVKLLISIKCFEEIKTYFSFMKTLSIRSAIILAETFYLLFQLKLPFSSRCFDSRSDLFTTLSFVAKYLLKVVQHNLNDMTGFCGINQI